MFGVVLYLFFCLLTGLCGTHRRMGFFGTFLITLFVSPIPVLVVLLLTGPSHRHVESFRGAIPPRDP